MSTIKLSPSLLDKYQDCPACFARVWQERQQRKTWREPPTYGLALGLAVHETIAHVNRRLRNGQLVPATEEVISRCFNPSHFAGREQAARARYEVAPMIDNYRNFVAKRGLSVVAVEQWVTGHQHVDHEIVLVLNGRIDVVFTDSTGAAISLDLKTGKILVPDDLETRLSTTAYRCLTKILLPKADRIQVSQLSLTTGVPATVELSEPVRLAAREQIFQLTRALGKDPSTTGPAFAPAQGCPYCSQSADCGEETLSV